MSKGNSVERSRMMRALGAEVVLVDQLPGSEVPGTLLRLYRPNGEQGRRALGRTRFNLEGKDLNRDWDKPADPRLAPENYALEKWLEGMIHAGRPPDLALELHNDGGGELHLSRCPVPDLNGYLQRMATLEALLRRHTWFTEGTTSDAFRNADTLGEGWLKRYGIDAAVHEFNCNWIAGLNDYPSARHWRAYGEQLATVFYEYFGSVNKR